MLFLYVLNFYEILEVTVLFLSNRISKKIGDAPMKNENVYCLYFGFYHKLYDSYKEL